jgi:glycosyltransferase involved in cell wall biosynthesis
MNNLFIYSTPHPAHEALADFLKCEKIKSSREGLAGIPFFGRLFNMWKVNSFVGNYDVVLSESISRDLVAGAYYKATHPDCKLVALLTDPKLYELKSAPFFDKLLTYWALDKAEVLLVGSEMMFNLVPDQFKSKTKLFYPGVKDIKSYLSKNAEFGKNLAFVGRLDDYKGSKRLLDLPEALENGAKLYVAGDGPNAPLFKNHTETGLFYVGKTKNALFMHQIASIYVSLADYEPSGVAILEAMAQGLVPVISSGVGYKNIVSQVDPSLVFYDYKSCLLKIQQLSNNKKYWTRLSKKCKKTASKYSYTYMIKEFKKVLTENKII